MIAVESWNAFDAEYYKKEAAIIALEEKLYRAQKKFSLWVIETRVDLIRNIGGRDRR